MLYFYIGEIKDRVYGKRQTENLFHVTKFPLYLSFTVHYNYTKICRVIPIISIRIVLSCSSHIQKFLNLNLTFAIVRKRDA